MPHPEVNRIVEEVILNAALQGRLDATVEKLKHLETDAQQIATEAHAGQKYGEHPYIFHCAQVVGVIREFGCEAPTILATGWLHDVLEDTDWTSEKLLAELSHGADDPIYSRVVRFVVNVTNEPGKNRLERHLKTYPKIRRDPESLIVKLADRIANVRECVANRDYKLHMYVQEHPMFRAALFSDEFAKVWECLDSLIAVGSERAK